MSAIKIIVSLKSPYEYEREGKMPSLLGDVKKDAERLFSEATEMINEDSSVDLSDVYPDGAVLQLVKPSNTGYREDENVLASYMDQIAQILDLIFAAGKYDSIYQILSTIQIIEANNLVSLGYLEIIPCDIVAYETPTASLGAQGLISASMEDGHGIVTIPDINVYTHPIPTMTVKYVTKLLSTFL